MIRTFADLARASRELRAVQAEERADLLAHAPALMRRWRAARGYDQYDAAAAVGFSRGYWGAVESGNQTIGRGLLARLCDQEHEWTIDGMD